MKTQDVVYEGTWEEISKHADEFGRRRMRVTVLPEDKRRHANVASPSAKRRSARIAALSPKNHQSAPTAEIKCKDKKTEEFLKEFRGAWVGNDFEECLKSVYATRSKAKF